MFRHKRCFFSTGLLIIICFTNFLTGQLYAQPGPGTSPALQTIIPTSPNAAALGKYGEIPVGYYTGVPNISVPVYEINTGSIKVPVSLSYHAAGVKVEEMASWAGLGWSLNAGGVITRQVRGIPDEISGGYLSTFHDTYRYIAGMSPSDQQTYFDNVASGAQDSQPDMFSFNFGNESGNFFFDTTGLVTQVPSTRNKFEFGTFLGVSNAWKVTTIAGEQYYFTAKENALTVPFSNGNISPTQGAITSWFLTEIVDAIGTDTVQFVYALSTSAFSTLTSQTKYLLNTADGNCNAKSPDNNTAFTTIVSWHLSNIFFRNGSIRFNANLTDRCDYPGDTALSSIEIRNNSNSFYKKYQLYHSYITTNTSGCDQTHPENSRLLLDSLVISGFNGPVNRYSFSYNKVINMPSRLSYNQDHWGYYNGANNQTDFIPQSDLVTISGAPFVITGADRDAHPYFTQALILQSITYPTGGRTEFQFENNTISNPPANLGLYLGTRTFPVNPNNNPGGSGPRLYIDTTFTITDNFQGLGGVNALISINNGGGDCAAAAQFGCPLVNITGPKNTGYILSNVTTFLPQGTYEVTIDLTSVTDPSIISNFFFQISWNYYASSIDSVRNNAPVSGLRVNRITDYNSDNSVAMVKKYTYLVPDSVNRSSGTLLSYPSYIGSITILQQKNDPFGNEYIDECPYVTISSGSNFPLCETQSSYTGYRYVQEILGENGEFGKNEYEFTAPDVFPDRVIATFPYPPATSFDWKRGLLIHSKNYRTNLSKTGYELIQEKINTYGDQNPTVTQGIKIGQNYFNQSSAIGPPLYLTSQYSTEAGWFPLLSDTTRIYDQNNLSSYSQVIHSYSYNPSFFLPVSDTTLDSKGQVVIKNKKYPLDFTGLTGSDPLTAGILNLQNKNVIDVTIEQYTQLQNTNGTNNRVASAVMTTYKPDKPMPDTIWTTELNAATTSFTASSVTGGSVSKSSLYRPRILFPKYDINGNVIEQQKISDVKTAYVWDYQRSYPIAEIKNADSSSVAYTSFEADGTGTWSVGSFSRDTVRSITGSKSYFLADDITRSGLNTGTVYIVSYWTLNSSPFAITGTISGYPAKGKTINGWTFYLHKVTGQSTISLSGLGPIDELRLYPAAAQMTTYTYSPLVGLTSQTDINNRIIYYEYDGLQRLKRVRDQDGNILKTYEYQYQASSGCGANCYIEPMQTLAGTNTLSYPVGIFNANGKLLGNVTNQAAYVIMWNTDTADSHRGTLAAGADSLHFQITLNTGKTLPPITGCRYYQVDLAWNVFDGVRSVNGVYVDFGDGTGMATPKTQTDTPKVIAPNTVAYSYINGSTKIIYLIHTYPDTSLKTLTFYHNDAGENNWLDNATNPATSLLKVKNLRGYAPQYMTTLGASCYQQPSMTSVASIANWNTINTITYFDMNRGDGINAVEHLSYAQDFMQHNKGLQIIKAGGAYRGSGYRDTTFKLNRLKSDWNTWFTGLQQIITNDDHWNREDLSALTQLNYFVLYPSTQDHMDGPSSPFIPIPTPAIDSMLIQIAAGAGRTVKNGVIVIESAGPARSGISDTAVQALKNQGWIVDVNDIWQ